MNDGNADKLTRLEEEGEVTADYLEEPLDIADPDGGIEVDVENGRVSVEIIVDNPDALDRLAGDDGGVLDALQELTRLVVQTETGERSRLMLDIAGFHTEHREGLWDITHETIARMCATSKAIRLGTMNPFECKVCHDMVADEGLTSEPEGAEPHRRVVVLSEDTDGE